MSLEGILTLQEEVGDLTASEATGDTRSNIPGMQEERDDREVAKEMIDNIILDQATHERGNEKINRKAYTGQEHGSKGNSEKRHDLYGKRPVVSEKDAIERGLNADDEEKAADIELSNEPLITNRMNRS